MTDFDAGFEPSADPIPPPPRPIEYGDADASGWWLSIIGGIALVALGIWLLTNLFESVTVLAWLIGISLIVAGVIEVLALHSVKEVAAAAWISGGLLVAAGIAVLVWPDATLWAIAAGRGHRASCWPAPCASSWRWPTATRPTCPGSSGSAGSPSPSADPGPRPGPDVGGAGRAARHPGHRLGPGRHRCRLADAALRRMTPGAGRIVRPDEPAPPHGGRLKPTRGIPWPCTPTIGDERRPRRRHRGGRHRGAVTAILVVRRRAPDGGYFNDGDRAAGVFGVLATGFAVLLGFVVFLAFTSYDSARSGAEAEALTVTQQIETAQLLPADVSGELTVELVCYARSVAGVQWDRMEAGTLGEELNPWGVALFETISDVEPQTAAEQAAYGKWLDQTSDREQARTDRVHGALGVIPTPLWFVLFFSSAVIFLYMLFFADSGERAVVQALMMGCGHGGHRDHADPAAVPRRPVPRWGRQPATRRHGADPAHHRPGAGGHRG